MNATKVVVLVVTCLMLIAAFVPAAHAIPTLQLYIEGSTYNSADESWTFTGDVFKIWVLGDVGSYGPITDVKLTIAFPSGLDPDNITLTPTTATADTSGIGGGVLPGGDPSVSPAPVLESSPVSSAQPSGPCGDNGSDGTIPCRGDNNPLATHGEFGAGVQWVEYHLGNFTLTDSPIGDFIDSFPTSFPSTGQINAYEVAVNQGAGTQFPAGTVLHFDAFDHVVQNNDKIKWVFAPFSHDAIDQPDGYVPQPSAVILFGLGLLGLWGLLRLRSQK